MIQARLIANNLILTLLGIDHPARKGNRFGFAGAAPFQHISLAAAKAHLRIGIQPDRRGGLAVIVWIVPGDQGLAVARPQRGAFIGESPVNDVGWCYQLNRIFRGILHQLSTPETKCIGTPE